MTSAPIRFVPGPGTLALIAATVLVDSAAVFAQERVSAELFLGSAVSVPLPLALGQDGEPRIRLTARYETRPLETPLYYGIRLALRDDRRGWELQLLHHKMYLTNPTAEIQDLEVTHGYNILTVNYVWLALPVDLRAGMGVVLPNVSGTVRGRDLGDGGGLLGSGYRLTGPSFLLGAGKRFRGSDHVSLVLEGQATFARVGVSVSDVEVSAPNIAFHGLIGLGYAF